VGKEKETEAFMEVRERKKKGGERASSSDAREQGSFRGRKKAVYPPISSIEGSSKQN